MKLITFIVAISLLINIHDLPFVLIEDYRLPQDICPLRYTVEITPFFLPRSTNRRFMYTGRTFINIYTQNPNVQEFTIHASGMEFYSVLVYKSGQPKSVPFTYDYNATTETVTFRMKEKLVAFLEYSLNFKYMGRMSLGDDGIYIRSYFDIDGSEKWIIMTQLRPTHARKLFPGFDDPYFKSIYEVYVSHPVNYSSYSNTILTQSRKDGSEHFYQIERYEKTPPFSTYQVSMIVCDFVTQGDDNFYVIARFQHINNTDFSYALAKQIFNYYNVLFRIPYYSMGNGILQMVAVPHFGKDGGDNWGLLLFDEDILVVEDQDDLEQATVQNILTTLSFKISRNWLGGSVSCEWWGYLWIVDGLARYYEYFTTDAIFPEFGLDKLFVIEQLHVIFNTDETNLTQPLTERYVSTTEGIARKIGDVTYMKGASVMRMIKHCITDDQFESMMAHFIEQNHNKVITNLHLLATLSIFISPSINVDIPQFFFDWTEQVGFPILSVQLSDDGYTAKIEQKRYIIYHDGSDPSLRYTIPITYATSVNSDFNNTTPITYFNKNQSHVTFHFAQPVEWIMFNIQQTSYYRVMYDRKLWNNLHHALCQENWSGIHELNRAQYIDDLFAYAKAGIFNYDDVFRWLDYLRTETNYIPWKAALNHLEYIASRLAPYEIADFGEFILFLTEKVYEKLGVIGSHDDPMMDIYTRKEIVNWNCRYGRDECISETGSLLSEYLNNGTEIPVDMRATVYCNGMRNGTEKDFDRLLIRLRLAKTRRENLRIRYGLSCSRNLYNVDLYMRIITSEEFPPEEKVGALETVYKENPENAWFVFQIIATEARDVAKAFHGWERVADLVISISQFFTEREQAGAFKNFVSDNRVYFNKACIEKLNEAYLNINYNQQWAIGYLGSLRSYLKSKSWNNTSWNKRSSTSSSFKNLFLLTLALLLCVLF